MFTGVITGVGSIFKIKKLGLTEKLDKCLFISAPAGYLSDVSLGDSIALNGACMTVSTLDAAIDQFTVDISDESLSKTTGLDVLGPINLEKSLRASDRLGGHIVSGHVDGVGRVTHFEQIDPSWELRVLSPISLAQFIAVKGSAVINGVSLTTNKVRDTADGCEICINLIPHTIRHTTLGKLKVGSKVNLEIDLIARYVQRMLTTPKRVSLPVLSAG